MAVLWFGHLILLISDFPKMSQYFWAFLWHLSQNLGLLSIQEWNENQTSTSFRIFHTCLHWIKMHHICSVSRKGETNFHFQNKYNQMHCWRRSWDCRMLLCCFCLSQQLRRLPCHARLLIKHPRHQAASCWTSLVDAN